MALAKMLHIADPQNLLRQLSGDGTLQMKNYDTYVGDLYEYRLSIIDCLRHVFTGVTMKEDGALGSGGVLIPLKGSDADIDELEKFLQDNEHYKGVSIRTVA